MPRKKEKLQDLVFYIPPNYDGNINMAGFTFKTRNLFEGILMASFGFAIGLSIMIFANLPWDIAICSILFSITTMPLLMLGIVGINDYSIFQWIGVFFKFLKGRTVSYYNPRIKDENVSIMMVKEDEDRGLPRDRIIKAYRKFEEQINAKNSIEMQENVKILLEDENAAKFFEDDEGYVDKPVEYMTSKEYRKYLKELKRRQKQELKEEKKRMKQVRRNAKKNKKL